MKVILNVLREETYRSFSEELEAIVELLNNWIELIPREISGWVQCSNSILGVLLFHSWKITNWIGYEILNGKYFEAFKNIRFVLEASVLSVILEGVIEERVYEEWGMLSELGLKVEIFKLWEKLKDKGAYRKKQKNKMSMIEQCVKRFIDEFELSEERKEKHAKVYISILSDERLGYSVPKMIEECMRLLSVKDKEDIEDTLKSTWRILNKYTHFTYTFIETTLNDPEFAFVEKMNEKLFTECFEAYLNTMDLFYSVLCWRFPNIMERMKGKVIDWWNKNFNRRFMLTEKVIQLLTEESGSENS